MALDKYQQEYALVHAHLGCFGQKRIIRIPIFHLGLPQVKVWLNRGDADVFWVQATRGCDAAALNYAERCDNGIRSFKVDAIKVHVEWHSKTGKDGSACDLELSSQDQALVKMLYLETRKEWAKLQSHPRLLDLAARHRLSPGQTSRDMVLTAADGEVVARIVPDMTSGKLLLRTSGDGGRLECRTADDLIRALGKVAGSLQSCSRDHLRLLRALRGHGRPQQDALEQVARAVTSGAAAEWSKAGVQVELVQIAKQQNSGSSTQAAVMLKVEAAAQRALEHASAAGLKHYLSSVIAGLHNNHTAGLSNWGLLRLLHASLALSSTCQVANTLDLTAALVALLQDMAPKSSKQQQARDAGSSDDTQRVADSYKALQDKVAYGDEAIRNDAFPGLESEDTGTILALPSASPSRFNSQAGTAPGSPGGSMVRTQRGPVAIPKLNLPATPLAAHSPGGMSLVRSTRLSRRGTSEAGTHRTTADNVRQPFQWLQQIGRSSGENLVAADLPAFYRHRELRQQLAGHQSRRSSASSARLLVLEPPREEAGMLQPTDPRLPLQAQCKLLALLCLRALAEGAGSSGGAMSLRRGAIQSRGINPMALLATELVAPELVALQHLLQLPQQPQAPLDQAVALRLVRYQKQLLLDYLAAGARASAEHERDTGGDQSARGTGRLLAHFADQLQSYAAPQHLDDMSFQEASVLLQLLRGYLVKLPAGPSAVSACLAQCGEALARLEHRLRGAGRVALWAGPQHALLKAMLELSCCLMESDLQAPAAALLLRSLASQDAVQLACDAARAVRLEQGDAAASPAAAESVALLATVWRFLGTLVRFVAQHRDSFKAQSNPSSAHRLLLDSSKAGSGAAMGGDVLLMGSATGTSSLSALSPAPTTGSSNGRLAPGASPVPSLQLSGLRLQPGSPKQLSAHSQQHQSARSAASTDPVRSISGVSAISLHCGTAGGGSSSRSRPGAPSLAEWLQPVAALVEPPVSLAAAHLENAPACYGRLQLQLQVLDFLQALFSCPEQALVASLLPTDYFVHLHSLGFLRAYHALPGAAGQPSGVKRMSASGSGGQPQLQLCMGHLKVLLALCRCAGPDTRRRFYQLSLLDSLLQELRLELDMFCDMPGRPRMDEQQQHQRPAYRPSPLAAPPAAAGDSPRSDSSGPGRGWPLRGYDLEEDLDALDEHEELYGEVEQLGFTPTPSRPTSASQGPNSAPAAGEGRSSSKSYTPLHMRKLVEGDEGEDSDAGSSSDCSTDSDGWSTQHKKPATRPFVPKLSFASRSAPLPVLPAAAAAAAAKQQEQERPRRPMVPKLKFSMTSAAAKAAAAVQQQPSKPPSKPAAATAASSSQQQVTPAPATQQRAQTPPPQQQQQQHRQAGMGSPAGLQVFPRLQLPSSAAAPNQPQVRQAAGDSPLTITSKAVGMNLLMLGNSCGAADDMPPLEAPARTGSPDLELPRLGVDENGGMFHTPPSLPPSASPAVRPAALGPGGIVFTGDLEEDAELLAMMEEEGMEAQLGFSDEEEDSPRRLLDLASDDSSDTGSEAGCDSGLRDQRGEQHGAAGAATASGGPRASSDSLASFLRKPSRPTVPSLRLGNIKLPLPVGNSAASLPLPLPAAVAAAAAMPSVAEELEVSSAPKLLALPAHPSSSKQQQVVFNPLLRKSLQSFPLAIDSPLEAYSTPSGAHAHEAGTPTTTSRTAAATSRALQQRDAARLRTYTELKAGSALYRDPQLHALAVEFALRLMLDAAGQLDPANLPQDNTDHRLQNLFLVLFYHLSYRDNTAVVDAVWSSLQAAAEESGSGSSSRSSKGAGAAAAGHSVLLRLLKLTAASLFDCELASCGELGRGAYATIIGARQQLADGTCRDVAVKVIEVAQQSHDCTNFSKAYSEVAVLEALAGTPGVARLLDYGVVHSAANNRSSFQLVMQRYRCSLKEWRLRLGDATAASHLHLFLAIFLQVVRTVERLHARGIIHFDLKGENVLLEPRPGVSDAQLFSPGPHAPQQHAQQQQQDYSLPFDTHLADFGESVEYGSPEGAFTQRSRGTECFQSPEMLLLGAGRHNRQHESFDRRRHRGVGAPHDVWGLGCMLYELLTGKYLFIRPECNAQMSDAGLVVRVTRGSDGPMELTPEERACLCDHPVAVELLQYMLVRDPTRRPSVGDLARRVEARLAGL